MHKSPFRSDNKITQSYNDGVVKIYTVSDSSEVGYAPVESYTLSETLRYSEERVGINRFYNAKQAQVEVARVIRCQKRNISTQDMAETEDGTRYRIEQIQSADCYPPSLDLTLSEIKQVTV